jgi:Flp pilus assembly protein TadG
MRTLLCDEDGTLALLTLLLLPTILLALVGVLELGAVRVVAERARIAADLATVTAVNDQDDAELARTGLLRPSPNAAAVARESLAVNIVPLAGSLATTPDAIAASADVAVFAAAPWSDPLTGRTYAGPTVRLAADLPIRTPAFAALLARPVTTIHLLSASSAQ